jgi:hypothetical protein
VLGLQPGFRTARANAREADGATERNCERERRAQDLSAALAMSTLDLEEPGVARH